MLKIHLVNTGYSDQEKFLSQLNPLITIDNPNTGPDVKIHPDDRMKANYIVYILNENCDFGVIANYIEDSCKRGKRILSCIATGDFSVTMDRSDSNAPISDTYNNRLRSSLSHAASVAKNNGARHFSFMSDLVEFLNQACQILEENKNE